MTYIDQFGLVGALPTNFGREIMPPADPSTININRGPQGLLNEFGNAPNRAPDLPGEYVGINYPGDLSPIFSENTGNSENLSS